MPLQNYFSIFSGLAPNLPLHLYFMLISFQSLKVMRLWKVLRYTTMYNYKLEELLWSSRDQGAQIHLKEHLKSEKQLDLSYVGKDSVTCCHIRKELHNPSYSRYVSAVIRILKCSAETFEKRVPCCSLRCYRIWQEPSRNYRGHP